MYGMTERTERQSHSASRPHLLHMQQALKLRKIQLSVVIEDIMGATGQASIRAASANSSPWYGCAIQPATPRKRRCQSADGHLAGRQLATECRQHGLEDIVDDQDLGARVVECVDQLRRPWPDDTYRA